MKYSKLVLGVVFSALSLSYGTQCNAKEKGKHIGTPEIMGKIHESMVKVLPHSVGYVGFSSKSNRLMLAEEIGKLEKLGKDLVRSTSKNDEAFKLIAKSFSDDTKEMGDSFRKQAYRHARFVFQNITSNCISCHTRVEGYSSNKKTPLYNKISSKHLSLVEKAELNTAIRRFDVALDQYEKAFSKKNVKQVSMIMLEGYVIDYMIVGLKVKQDTKRVLSTLENLSFNPVVPVSVQRVVSKWVGFLKTYNEKKDYSNIDVIAKLYDEGQDLNTHPFDSSSALASILVEKHLQNLLVNEEALPQSVRAKAYLLYGLSEISLKRPLQLSKADYFLERSILSYPKSQTAKDAYSVLEDHIYFENSGSSGVNVPSDLLEKLSKLRKKIK